ncbi:MAG TPA: HNH endonuclease [Anaerolineales bacterium]|nr:HNH endonuclease [Anaerolineales bacterium]
MKTFLLAWSPIRSRSEWDNFSELSRDVKNGNIQPIRWSCGNSKRLQKGDRVFFIRLAKEPKGLFASGYVAENSYEDTHWEREKAKQGKTSYFVKVKLDVLLDPNSEDQILSRKLLDEPPFSDMHWDTQVSGVEIPSDIAGELETLWRNFNNALNFSFPEEIEETQGDYFEGAVRRVSVNAYERNPEARRICIETLGVICSICGFDFEKSYGEIGKGFIHVHHIKQLSGIGINYQVNPFNDLTPVCPNCHAIIHRRKPPYTIEEVKRFLKK